MATPSKGRAHCAAPALKDAQALPTAAIGLRLGERVDFDYAGRGDHLRRE